MTQRAERPAARILLLDDAGRILLFRFTPHDQPPLWATPGGALDPGETFEAAAARELREETGLALDCGAQVARRHAEFVTLHGQPVVADERYFLVRSPGRPIDPSGQSEHERGVMREWRWFEPAELADWPKAIFPEDLTEMLAALEPA